MCNGYYTYLTYLRIIIELPLLENTEIWKEEKEGEKVKGAREGRKERGRGEGGREGSKQM